MMRRNNKMMLFRYVTFTGLVSVLQLLPLVVPVVLGSIDSDSSSISNKQNKHAQQQHIHPTVGFGTAALGDDGYNTIITALENGFRIFDTAEADWWYNQTMVGQAVQDYFTNIVIQHNQQRCLSLYNNDNFSTNTNNSSNNNNNEVEECRLLTSSTTSTTTTNSDNNNEESTAIASKKDKYIVDYDLYTLCEVEDIRIQTKIGPWDLVSEDRIRTNAKESRQTLVGFCDSTLSFYDEQQEQQEQKQKYKLDLYLIHAPRCWSKNWHPKCSTVEPTDTMSLRDVWLAMESIVSIDHTASRIGLSNINVNELLDIIQFVQERQEKLKQQNQNQQMPVYYTNVNGQKQLIGLPRMPDAVQIYSDPLEPNYTILKLCQQYNIEFISYSTLGTQHVMKHNQKNPVLTHPTIIQLSTKYNRSSAEIVLSWAIQHNMSIIPRSTNLYHIQQLSRLLPGKVKLSNTGSTSTTATATGAAAQGFLSIDDFQLINEMSTI